MAAIYRDDCGRLLDLGRCLGSGGEGSIYELAGVGGRVVKLYHTTPLRHGLNDKLKAMVAMGSDELREAAAWPESAVADGAGAACGFVMPFAGGREIHDIYQPASRSKYFPAANWKFLAGVGRNLAAALETLHQHGVVVGDFNQRNVRVVEAGIVKFVDCDSFQIKANGATFRAAGVGVDEYIPPELQGRDLRDVIFTEEHDDFALAVIIFQLLYLGRHPFVPDPDGGAAPAPLGELIKKGSCVFAHAPDRFPPPGAAGVPNGLRSMFEGALLGAPGRGRPTAGQWREALGNLYARMRACTAGKVGHVFFDGLKACPWCLGFGGRSGGYDPFATVSADYWTNHFSIRRLADRADHLRRRVESLSRPLPAATFRPLAASAGRLPKEVEDAIAKIGARPAWREVLLRKELQAVRREVERRHRALFLAREGIRSLRNEYENLRARAEEIARECRGRAEPLLRALSGLPGAYEAALAEKQSAVSKEELSEFLRGQMIAGAGLGLPQSVVFSLESAGFVTAADIDVGRGPYSQALYSGQQLRIKVRGIGPKRWAALVSWRRGLERIFRPKGGPPDAVVAGQRRKAAMDGARFGAECATLIERAEAARREIEHQIENLQSRMESQVASLAEAEADWNAVAGLVVL
jgi:hypothetical protein